MRTRTLALVLCLAAVLLAVAGFAPALVCAVLVALFIFPEPRAAALRRTVIECDAQPVALVSLKPFRAPPSAG